jgi:uncharacterized protein YjbI with pentapeptide repeats
MKFEITSRYDSSVLFSVETESLRLALELAARSGADLYGANLSGAYLGWANLYGANLSGADLSGADLTGADLYATDLYGTDLSGAKGIEYFPISISGHKHTLKTTQSGELRIGCHINSFDWWEKHAEAVGRQNEYSKLDVEIYKLHIAHIAKIANLLWAAKEETTEEAS